MARRARELAARSASRLDVSVRYRDVPLPAARFDVVYVFDSAASELGQALLRRLGGARVVVETGDVSADLRRAAGVGAARVAWVELLELASWRWAHSLVVRGEGFVDVLRAHGIQRRVDVLPEGVDLERFRPLPGGPGRTRLGVGPGDVAVGVVGSIVWSPQQQIAYGWELVEALPRVPDRVKAVVVGEGNGLERLQARARELGVSDRLVTPGRIAHEDVPEVLGALDAVVWTQTPDDAGRCRTTLKLPEYLASGRFVIASDVGEARRSVNGNGRRIPYAGGRDPRYVAGVAETIRELAGDPSLSARGLAGRESARRFDWERVAAGFCGIVERALA